MGADDVERCIYGAVEHVNCDVVVGYLTTAGPVLIEIRFVLTEMTYSEASVEAVVKLCVESPRVVPGALEGAAFVGAAGFPQYDVGFENVDYQIYRN